MADCESGQLQSVQSLLEPDYSWRPDYELDRPVISAIILSIILHAQAVMPVLGSTKGASGAAPTAPKFSPLVLPAGRALVLPAGTSFVVALN
jgi:hypothetical protein